MNGLIGQEKYHHASVRDERRFRQYEAALTANHFEKMCIEISFPIGVPATVKETIIELLKMAVLAHHLPIAGILSHDWKESESS